MTEPCSLLTHH